MVFLPLQLKKQTFLSLVTVSANHAEQGKAEDAQQAQGAVTSHPCLGVSRAQMCYLWSCGCCLKSLVFLKNVFGDAANTVDFI